MPVSIDLFTYPRGRPSGRHPARRAFQLATIGALSAGVAGAQVNVTTYHGDNFRTGWNSHETTLTPSVVGGASFGVLATVTLDGQVDAQPLYVSGVTIAGAAHNVVYAATENNSIYAIDADSGAILAQHNFGAPVPMATLPGGCDNNANTVGITATPVIDTAKGALYAVTYTYEKSAPVYRIHQIGLTTLTDMIPAPVISKSRTLGDGSVYRFNPAVSRQRAALLEANGNVYAAFTSFCDVDANLTRGWVLGWNAGTLAPLAGKELIDQQTSSDSTYFLSTIWMSGYGIAADEVGSLFFVTGNSDPTGQSYNRPLNYEESVVKLSADLTKVQDSFAPQALGVDVVHLDHSDTDLGSGGVMVAPQQPGKYPRIAIAAGKSGVLYILNRDALGGNHFDGIDHILGEMSLDTDRGCWCGPSYYQGADGIGRVVTSVGVVATVWKIKTSTGGKPVLVKESVSPQVNTGQDGGFFTTISSNGTAAGSLVIWTVTRPTYFYPADVDLVAYDPSTIDGSGQMKQLFYGGAGFWPNTRANANLVPLVANGKVYVGANATLTIFGVKSGNVVAATAIPAPRREPEVILPGHAVSGIVEAVDGRRLSLRTRAGRLTVDISSATLNHLAAVPVVGHAMLARGDYDAKGVLWARTMLRAKDSPNLWQPDR